MVSWEDTGFQLVDLPPITRDFLEPWVPGIIRSADAALLVLDLAADDSPDEVEASLLELSESHTELVVNCRTMSRMRRPSMSRRR